MKIIPIFDKLHQHHVVGATCGRPHEPLLKRATAGRPYGLVGENISKERKIMAVIKLTSENFEKEIKSYEGVALIDFYADWCGPCKMVSPVVDELAESQDKYKICKVNVDDEAALAAEFSVMSIPTLVVMKNGEVADTHIGLAAKSKILAMLAAAE